MPVLLDCTVELAGAISEAVVTVAVGTTPSTTIAFAPAILLAGKVEEVSSIPERSVTSPALNEIAFAVRSALVSPLCTV